MLPQISFDPGTIHMFVGPYQSGKTNALALTWHQALLHGFTPQAFRFSHMDDMRVNSTSNLEPHLVLPASRIDPMSDALTYLREEAIAPIVIIDDCHLAPDGLDLVVKTLSSRGKILILSANQKSSFNSAFVEVGKVMCLASTITILHGSCFVCKEAAHFNHIVIQPGSRPSCMSACAKHRVIRNAN